jgi:translation initiation factor eIF-2B subunit delta
MSDETNGAPPGSALQESGKPQKSPTTAAAAAAPKGKPAKDETKAPEATGEKKLTGAELKAKLKAEKAARRAQQKETKEVAKGEAAVSSKPQPLGPSASEVKGKQKGKDGATAAPTGRPGGPVRATLSAVVAEQKTQIPECFSHLSMARRIPMTQADKDVHPSVLALGQQMATFAIDESIARLKATLLAFRRVCCRRLYNLTPTDMM